MSTMAFDQFALTRIADFAHSLSRLHLAVGAGASVAAAQRLHQRFRRLLDILLQVGIGPQGHLVDRELARIGAADRDEIDQGYDLIDDVGMLTDWWGYCWMILAEKRGLLTPENRAAARAAIEERYLAAPNVIGVIVGR